MRQELKQMSPKEKQFTDMLEDPELQPLLERKVAQILKTKTIDSLLEEIIFQKLSENGVLGSIELLKQFAGVSPDTHCIGEDWEWDEMDSLERRMYPEKKKIIVQPLQVQLVQLQERIDNSSIPVLHEKETILISANETEVRARLLKDKLASLPPKHEKRFMLGTEVQKFLLNEIPEEHRATAKSVRQASIEVMKKTVEQFPNEVRMGKNSKKRNFIEYIVSSYDPSM